MQSAWAAWCARAAPPGSSGRREAAVTVRRVFITGASTGIGAALARHYAGTDTAIGLFARRRDLPEALAASLPGRAAIYAADVTDAPAVAAAAQDFLARH